MADGGCQNLTAGMKVVDKQEEKSRMIYVARD